MSDQKKNQGIPHPLKHEQTRNAQTAEKQNILEYPKKVEKILSLKIEKCRTKKKLGHSASTQTRVDTKCPNSWKKTFWNIPQNLKKNTKCQNRKMSGQKKRRAFRFHSNMSKHEMPKQLKKTYSNVTKIQKLSILRAYC